MAMENDAQRRVFLRERADADLTFIFEEAGIDLDLQVAMVQAGYTSVQRFTGIADTRAEVRAALREDFRVDPATNGAPDRAKAAAVIAAWESAGEYRKKDVQLRAEAHSLNVSRPATIQERTAMRRALEAAHGKMPSKEVPNSDYLSSKLEECEHDEPTASPLDEVLSLDDDEAQSLSATVDPSGRIRISKAKNKAKLPASTEELRMRLRVEGNTWLMLAAKCTNRSWLQGLTPSTFGRYTDWLLGERVFDMKIPMGDTMESLRPSWTILLNFEYQCRKAAFRWVREENMTLADALQRAMGDSELKEVHFTSPVAFSMRAGKTAKADGEPPSKRARAASSAGTATRQASRGRAGKGKGKGKSKGRSDTRASSTEDGRQICFAYNDPEGCRRADCNRVHICRVRGCGGPHPAYQCPTKGAGRSN